MTRPNSADNRNAFVVRRWYYIRQFKYIVFLTSTISRTTTLNNEVRFLTQIPQQVTVQDHGRLNPNRSRLYGSLDMLSFHHCSRSSETMDNMRRCRSCKGHQRLSIKLAVSGKSSKITWPLLFISLQAARSLSSYWRSMMPRSEALLGPFHGAIAVPCVTRCRCCRCCCGHRCARGVRQ